jgi:intracellular septation protein A
MKDLLQAAKFLLFDLASVLLFFLLFSLTHSMPLAVLAGLALALALIGLELLRHKPVHTLQWISLVAVLASGAGTLHTGNPLYVMLQPTAIYLLVGLAMLRRGWMERYLPPPALEHVPDLAITFGYVWAGLMFLSAAINLGLAFNLDAKSWSLAISAWGTASKFGLFFVQFGVMKFIGRRRYRARLAPA